MTMISSHRHTGRVLARLGPLAALLALSLALGLGLASRADAFVYWANPNGGSPGRGLIGRMNNDATNDNLAFITGASAPCGVAVDSAHVYWANRSATGIGRANLDGSSPNQSFIPIGASCALAVDSAHVYWAAGNSIERANLDGSGANEFYIRPAGTPCAIAVNSSHIYWVNEGAHTIGRANLDGSSPNQSFLPILGGLTDGPPCGVAVSSNFIYWSNEDNRAIGRANLDGSSPNQFFIPGLAGPTFPCGLAVDPIQQHIYWASFFAGQFGPPEAVGRVNVDGTGINDAFGGFGVAPCGVAVDRLPVFTGLRAFCTTCFPKSWTLTAA
jgi:hypothetical protein